MNATIEPDSTPRRGLRLLLVVMCALAVPAAPTLATAQSTPADLSDTQKRKYLNLLQNAKQAYSDGEFRKSADLLLEAKEILYNPAIDYRIALCYERLGKPQKAITHYEAFLEKKPESDKRPAIEKTLERLRKRVQATLGIESTPDGATVTIEGRGDVGTTPLELTLAPGEYTVTLEKEGLRKRTETIELGTGAQRDIDWTLEKAAVADGEGDDVIVEPEDPNPPVALFAVGGTALAASAVSTVLFAQADKQFLKIDENRPDYTRDEAEAAATRSDTFKLTAISTGVIGAGALTWAAITMMNRGNEAEPKAQRTPRIRVGLGRVSISGRF